jgi:putative endonuclease
MSYFIYILTNKKFGTLYIGITRDLVRRIYEHKEKLLDGFSKKYGLDKLVYYEIFDSVIDAISREKQLKNWKREWKIELIKKMNPEWKDLYSEVI